MQQSHGLFAIAKLLVANSCVLYGTDIRCRELAVSSAVTIVCHVIRALLADKVCTMMHVSYDGYATFEYILYSVISAVADVYIEFRCL